MILRNKFLSGILLASLVFSATSLSLSVSQPAQANSTVKLIWRKKMTPTSYQINQAKAKHAYAYSAGLARKRFKLANYTSKGFKAYYHQKLRVNKKSLIYYYVKPTSGKKVAGWVWRGYLTKVKAPSTSVSSNSTNESFPGTSVSSKSDLQTTVNAAPDLNPVASLLDFSSEVYTKYHSFLSQQYNLGQFASTGVFNDHKAKIYVQDSRLTSYVEAAIGKWNAALGQTVFSMGTKDDHTLTIKFSSSSNENWDGLFSNDTIQVNVGNFTNPYYANDTVTTSSTLDAKLATISNEASELLDNTNILLNRLKTNFENQYNTMLSKASAASPTLKASLQKQLATLQANYVKEDQLIRDNYELQLEDLRQSIKDAYLKEQPSLSETSTTNYWTTVILHELGHGLGLYHTPYRNDVMYADSSTESDASPSPVKYAWTAAKDLSDPRAYTTATLSDRDVNRAKLAELLGYW